MLALNLPSLRRPLRLLCLGAHSDDLEIGCGGTVLHWLATKRRLEVTWAVFSATGGRADEARRSATVLLRGAAKSHLVLNDLRDGHFPSQFVELKAAFERLKRTAPDIIFSHRLEDRHQDHRAVAEATWQTFRDHLILEYEIPKYEGDLGQPNLYIPLPASAAKRKVEHLMKHFETQRGQDWFRRETFYGLMQTRAVECRASSGLAEAFVLRKAVL